MKRIVFLLSVMLMALSAACQAPSTPTPTATSIPEPTTAPATPTIPPTWTPTPIPTSAPVPTSTPISPPTPAATPTSVPNDVWVDAVNGLNLRAEAKVDAKLVATLKHQQHLVAIGQATAPDAGGVTWQNVRTDDGQTGWVSTQFLTKTNPAAPTATPAPTSAPAATPAASSSEAWVNSADGLNLRAQAVNTATVIALLPFGAHVALTGAQSAPDASGTTWQSVRTDDNKTGFVSAQFLSATKPVTPTTPTPGAATPVAIPVTATIPATTTTPVGDMWVIAANGLNLRAQPDSTAGVVATLSYGQHLIALAPKTAPDASGTAWQNVRTDANQTGWASANFLATTPPATATVTMPSSVQAAGELLRRLNELRVQNGLSLITSNALLTAAAQRHSQDMAQTGIVSHIGSDGSTAPQRIGAAGYAGQHRDEVISGGQATLDDVWNTWLSDRLQANILLNSIYTDVGIAVVNAGGKIYYTITVGGP